MCAPLNERIDDGRGDGGDGGVAANDRRGDVGKSITADSDGLFFRWKLKDHAFAGVLTPRGTGCSTFSKSILRGR